LDGTLRNPILLRNIDIKIITVNIVFFHIDITVITRVPSTILPPQPPLVRVYWRKEFAGVAARPEMQG
jgi:hypothetical protein